ncbi:MAG TPA: hypothetical protein PKW42_09325 [bacterium]|nr:hypothetical protein [bacterium]
MARTSFITFLPSAARNTSGQSGSFGLYDMDEILVFLNVSAVSGASSTLDVKVQTQGPDGVWYDLQSFTQKTAAGQEAKAITVFGETLRIAYTIGGSSPSFTFSVTAVAKARS